jgi:hypothetical protein
LLFEASPGQRAPETLPPRIGREGRGRGSRRERERGREKGRGKGERGMGERKRNSQNCINPNELVAFRKL